ncbi:hypothetical protein T492DRAFT_978431 [Pavlovales sp. CCMP2436]|nr:hypothetical protein T492DRAFT_978431 [Pavlovales sp. CCMP2436]
MATAVSTPTGGMQLDFGSAAVDNDTSLQSALPAGLQADDDDDSLQLALRLQAEEEGLLYDDGAAESEKEANDPELEASLALAMQLQQQDDANQLRAALVGMGAIAADADEEDARSFSPSQLDYEQLTRLGENVGHVSRGASQESVEELPVRTHAQCAAPHSNVILGAECAICRMPFEPDDELRVMRCRHAEHKECLDQWLLRSKQCPLCQQEVVVSGAGGV